MVISNWQSRLAKTFLFKPTRTRRARIREQRLRTTAEFAEARVLPATFVVTTTSDVTDSNDGLLTLREAVAEAAAAPGDDFVEFNLAQSEVMITLTQGEIELNDSSGQISIGTNGSIVRIDGNAVTRIFGINHGVNAVFVNLELANGRSNYGGAIRNEGMLTLTNVDITDSTATIDGGAVWNSGRITVDHSEIEVLPGSWTTGLAIH